MRKASEGKRARRKVKLILRHPCECSNTKTNVFAFSWHRCLDAAAAAAAAATAVAATIDEEEKNDMISLTCEGV